MPLFDVECESCGEIFEYLQINSDDFPICPKCQSSSVKKIFSMMPNIRMNPDDILHTLPDPTPPLSELVGKGTEGFKELKNEQRQLKEYTRRKDKQGNTEWIPKEKKHYDMGRKRR